MIHQKIQFAVETILIGMAFHWQPFFGIMASAAAIVYYASMLKINVVDKKYYGSWKQYFKLKFNINILNLKLS